MVSGGTALATEFTLSLMIVTYSIFTSSKLLKTLQQTGITVLFYFIYSSSLNAISYIVLYFFSAINTTVFYCAYFTKSFSNYNLQYWFYTHWHIFKFGIQEREWKREATSIYEQHRVGQNSFSLAPSLVVLSYISIHVRDITSVTWQIEYCPICQAFLGVSLLESVFHRNNHFCLLQPNYMLPPATQVSCFQSLPSNKQNVKTHLDFILPHFTSKISRCSLSYLVLSLWLLAQTHRGLSALQL